MIQQTPTPIVGSFDGTLGDFDDDVADLKTSFAGNDGIRQNAGHDGAAAGGIERRQKNPGMIKIDDGGDDDDDVVPNAGAIHL